MEQEQLDKLHRIELDILDVIIQICTDNNITYYLAGGSVLGAIRHKGIIPWDDDIDVMMSRSDLQIFAKACETQLPQGYFYQSSETDSHYHHIFSKVRKDGTQFVEEQSLTTGQHNGIFVDIFPLDCAKKAEGIQSMQACLANKLEKILKVKDHIIQGNPIDKAIAYLFSSRFLIKLQRIILSLRNSSNSEYYVNFGSQYGIKKQTMNKTIYYPPSQVEFEQRICNVPNDYDFFLKQLYGNDYMKLPPENKRKTHNPILISFGEEKEL